MSDSSVPADANVGWEELQSSSGSRYRIKASNYDIADKPTDEANIAEASGPSFQDLPVNWHYGTEGAPSQDIQNRTAITWYKLQKAEWYSPFSYKLTINCKDTYTYRFTDETGDTYKLDVWQNSGTHSVEYSSDKPTIVKISGN
ncbi:hypothetical protein KCU98_g2810, partial [Aureobasidium melanogenum]